MQKSTLQYLFVALLSACAPLTYALQWGELEQEIKTTIENLRLGRHSVETKYTGGSLTVSGYVSSETEKAKVIEALSKLKGITQVTDELDVKNEGPTAGHSDDPLRKNALDAIKRIDGLGSYEVEILSQDSVLTLSGMVSNPRDRVRIAEAVQTVAGVKGVTNMLKVAPPPSDQEVEMNVWQALQKNEDLDVEGIEIKASSGIVTVKGKRTNHREIDRILSIVNMADGVHDVKSEMKIGK